MEAYTVAMDWKIQLKVVYSSNSNRIKISVGLFGIHKLILKCI